MSKHMQWLVMLAASVYSWTVILWLTPQWSSLQSLFLSVGDFSYKCNQSIFRMYPSSQALVFVSTGSVPSQQAHCSVDNAI